MVVLWVRCERQTDEKIVKVWKEFAEMCALDQLIPIASSRNFWVLNIMQDTLALEMGGQR